MKRPTVITVITALTATALVLPATAAEAERTPETDMSVRVTGPAEASPGAMVEYVVTVANEGPEAAPLIVATTMPKGTTKISHDSRPVVDGGIPVDTLNPGESRTLRIAARIGNHKNAPVLPAVFRAGGSDQGQVLFNDTNTSNNAAEVRTKNLKQDSLNGPDARLGITGGITGTGTPGSALTQTVTIGNTGVHRATGVWLRAVVNPASGPITKVTTVEGATGSHGTTGLNYRLPNLDPGKTHVITVTTKAAGTHLGPLGGDYYLGGSNGGDHELVLR
ncbi:hypothetical protein ACFWPV_07215 [Streptomyces uncialis]|uniref:hypothetical protein n=1 Tax=Streptomyces uncialis TaxID=1048205 RepID=UPI00365D1D81